MDRSLKCVELASGEDTRSEPFLLKAHYFPILTIHEIKPLDDLGVVVGSGPFVRI
jgi:hypothetical protein